MLHNQSYYTLATTLYLKMDPDYIFKLEALGLDAEAKGRWHNDVIVAMASAFFEAERDGAVIRHLFLLKFEIFLKDFFLNLHAQ